MQVWNMPVPRKKCSQFFELFNEHGCRHLRNPYWCGEELRVSFSIPVESKARFDEDWSRMNTAITEKCRAGWLVRLLRMARGRLLPNA